MREYKFHAFISYRRGEEDEKLARWFQRRLEAYRIPSVMAGKKTAGDEDASFEIPKRLTIFRDKTDLGSHPDLEQGLSRNLENSRFLIVVCSPRSTASPYVADEVRCFREAGRGDCIIPFIIDGTPDPKDGEQQCYPPTLPASSLGVLLSDGTKEEALIKTIARLLRVEYSDLYRRHLRAQRRLMIRALIVSFAILALVAGLAAWALVAERRAAEQREEAEGLIRFLVFDMGKEAFDYIPLKARLIIADKIQAYHTRWGTAGALNRYTKARYLMDLATTSSMTANDEKNRQLRFEALEILTQLHEEKPDDEAYFELYAQILRQIGTLLKKTDPDAAEKYFHKSLSVGRAFLSRNPNSPIGLEQTAEATEALAARAVIGGRPEEAQALYRDCFTLWSELFRRYPEIENDPFYLEKRAQLYSSMGELSRIRENFTDAAAISEKALECFAALFRADPDNLNVLSNYGYELDNATILQTQLGRLESADAHHREGLRVKRLLLARDPENVYSQYQLAVSLTWGAVLRIEQKNAEAARGLLTEAEAIIVPLTKKDPENAAYISLLNLVSGTLKQPETVPSTDE